jgi:hypothetical protein
MVTTKTELPEGAEALVEEPKEELDPKADNEFDDTQCKWLVVTVRCRIPLGEGECMPTGCDANCPARIEQIQECQKREKENLRFYS